VPSVLFLFIAGFFIIFPFDDALSSEKVGLDTVASSSPQVIDMEAWGIYNGCISSSHIRKMKVIDEYSALLLLVDGRQVKLHFKEACPGISQHGFVYTARNNLFCTQSYSVRVLHTGAHCQVESFEPLFAGQ
jgi:uncharacterized protein (DUF2235 family)